MKLLQSYPKNIAICLLLTFASSYGAIIHLDIGHAENPTEAPGFNNVTEETTTIDLVDDTDTLTGFSLSIVAEGTQGNNIGVGGSGSYYEPSDGPYPALIASVPETALEDGLFLRDDPPTQNEFIRITISGLSFTEQYSFIIYGARGNGGGLETIANVTHGGGESTGSISDVSNNDTELILFDNLLADSSGEIELAFTTALSSNTTGAINYVQIITSEIVEEDTVTIESFEFNENGGFDIVFDGLDTEKTYELRHSPDLLTPFASIAESAKIPAASTDTYTDLSPSPMRGFYQLFVVSP